MRENWENKADFKRYPLFAYVEENEICCIHIVKSL
jgi:hypothetical protein